MEKTAWSRRAILGLAGVFLGTGCAEISKILEPSAKSTSSGGADMSEAILEPYNGPKARISVVKFEAKAAKAYGYVGDGLADMLIEALFRSNRYIVLERDKLAHVLAEQDFGASNRVRKETAPKIGELENAELQVIGAVTEFEPDKASVDANIAAIVGGTAGYMCGWPCQAGAMIIGAFGGSIKSSHIAINIRVVEVRTGRIVATESVEAETTDFAGLGSFSGPTLVTGLSGFSKTSMEKAIRIAISKGVAIIVSKTPVEFYRFDASGKPISGQPATKPAAKPKPNVKPPK